MVVLVNLSCNSEKYKRRQTTIKSKIQFRVVLVNIVLFLLFFDFINIFSTFYIFTYLTSERSKRRDFLSLIFISRSSLLCKLTAKKSRPILTARFQTKGIKLLVYSLIGFS